MKTATLRLIEAAEHLNPTGVIGDGTVYHFHELAALARLEQAEAAPLYFGNTSANSTRAPAK